MVKFNFADSHPLNEMDVNEIRIFEDVLPPIQPPWMSREEYENTESYQKALKSATIIKCESETK